MLLSLAVSFRPSFDLHPPSPLPPSPLPPSLSPPLPLPSLSPPSLSSSLPLSRIALHHLAWSCLLWEIVPQKCDKKCGGDTASLRHSDTSWLQSILTSSYHHSLKRAVYIEPYSCLTSRINPPPSLSLPLPSSLPPSLPFSTPPFLPPSVSSPGPRQFRSVEQVDVHGRGLLISTEETAGFRGQSWAHALEVSPEYML